MKQLLNHNHPFLKSLFTLVAITIALTTTPTPTSISTSTSKSTKSLLASASVSASPITTTPFHPQKLKRFIHSRCSNPLTPSSAIWSWEGRLVDPTNGKIIANVEGIELVRTLAEIERPDVTTTATTNGSNSSRSSSAEERTNKLWRFARGLRRLHDLKVKDMLTSSTTTNDRNWDYAGTILCRKLFCYSPAPMDENDYLNVNRNNNNNSSSGNNKNRSSKDIMMDHSNHQGKGMLLKEYKHNPNSPVRNIKMQEAIALYDTATTFVSRERGNEMEIVTEWPDGRWVQSRASVGLENDMSTGENTSINNGGGGGTSLQNMKKGTTFPFGFTTYVRRSGKGELPSLPITKRVKATKASTSTSIPRSKFIQFGKDEDSENRSFGGARETYSYIMRGKNNSNNNGQISRPKRYKRAIQEKISNLGEAIGLWDVDNAFLNFLLPSQNQSHRNIDKCSTVQYTRYGEAPPWYGPGRMCTLELVGRRVDSVTDAPPLAARLAATHVPGFMSVHTPISFEDGTDKMRRRKKGGDSKLLLDQRVVREQLIEDTAAINAVKWFRGNEESSSLPLQILPDGDGEENDVSKKLINGALDLMQRIRDATTFSA